MHIKAYAYLIVATLCWGGNAVVGKLAVGHVSPMMLTMWRWALASAIIFAISLPQLKRDWPVAKRHLPVLIFLGAVGYTTFNVLLYSAVHYTTAINVTIEQAGIPFLIFLANFILFRIRVSLAQVLGFSLTLVGVALTASHGDLKTLLSLSVNFGDGLMLIAVAAYAAYTIALRWRPQVDWRTLMAIPALAALVCTLPLVAWEHARNTMMWPDAPGWIAVLYTAVFASLVAQIFYVQGIIHIGANRAGLFINLVPVFGTLLSVVIIGEELHLFHVVALVLALGGIALAERGKPAER
ncbi:Permease of the drug/metabolite transporter (DMT) superfamily [Rhizobium sp. RU35A]|uniref:DMT family transporter n=1 Tax=Rhizobium sp. RU35A TaxID=1907414 RepID=UPI000954F084|nr:DMT family transporter [Rhizobium sp. RU35A]SIQ17813.1 Permease of the drug/metabolite transporter (DMT) superfamily [Rhizobium sp. RU35A]